MVSPTSNDKSIFSPLSMINTARGVPASMMGIRSAKTTSGYSREINHKVPHTIKGKTTAATQRHTGTRFRLSPCPRYPSTTRHIFARFITKSSCFIIPTSRNTRLTPAKSSSFHTFSHSASPGFIFPSSIALNHSFSSFVLIRSLLMASSLLFSFFYS